MVNFGKQKAESLDPFYAEKQYLIQPVLLPIAPIASSTTDCLPPPPCAENDLLDQERKAVEYADKVLAEEVLSTPQQTQRPQSLPHGKLFRPKQEQPRQQSIFKTTEYKIWSGWSFGIVSFVMLIISIFWR
jgi:hypothetical protein